MGLPEILRNFENLMLNSAIWGAILSKYLEKLRALKPAIKGESFSIFPCVLCKISQLLLKVPDMKI